MKKGTCKTGIWRFAGSLIVDQFLAVMAALLLTNILGFFFPRGLAAVNIIVCLFVYALFCYVDSWNRGFSDYNRIKLGQISNTSFHGVSAGFVAAVPGFVLALTAYLNARVGLTLLPVFESDLTVVLNRFWQLPFNALFFYANEVPIINFVFPLFLPLVAGTGYMFGVHQYTLRQLFVYAKDND